MYGLAIADDANPSWTGVLSGLGMLYAGAWWVRRRSDQTNLV